MVSRQVDGASGLIFGHNSFHLICYMVVHKDISAYVHRMGDPETHLRVWLHGSTAGACPPLGFHKATARGANPSKGFLVDTFI